MLGSAVHFILKLPAWVKGLAAIVLVLSVVYFIGSSSGARGERAAQAEKAERIIERTREAQDALRGRADEAAAAQERERREIHTEVRDAVERIEAHAGGALVIDRAVACDALASIRRLRARTEPGGPSAADHGAGEPCPALPARAPS